MEEGERRWNEAEEETDSTLYGNKVLLLIWLKKCNLKSNNIVIEVASGY